MSTYSGNLLRTNDVAGTFIPTLWSTEVQRQRDAKFVLSDCVQRVNFVGKSGDTIRIPIIGRAAVHDKQPGKPVILQTRNEDHLDVKVDRYKESSFGIEDIVKLQSAYKNRQHYIEEAGYAIARDLDNALLAMRATVASDMQIFRSSTGTAAGDPLPLDYDSILAAVVRLGELDVPDMGLKLIVSPSQMGDILNIERLVNRDYISNDAIKKGRVMTALGVEIVRTSQITMNTLTAYRNGDGATPQPAPGVVGSPYQPTQDPIVGNGLPRGKTGAEVAQPFQSAILCHPSWAKMVCQKKPNVEHERNVLLQSDICVTTHVYGVKRYYNDAAILIHTAG